MVTTPAPERQLTLTETEVIGALIVEALTGEISNSTRDQVKTLEAIPEPLGHIVRYTQGFLMDNKVLAKDLVDEIRIICIEIQS